MWDSFTSGVAISIMRNSSYKSNGENEFAEMEFMNITVVTSNEPYGISNGSNLFFDGRKVPKFNLKKGGVHSGHVQKGVRDPFCIVENGKGRCKVIKNNSVEDELMISRVSNLVYLSSSLQPFWL